MPKVQRKSRKRYKQYGKMEMVSHMEEGYWNKDLVLRTSRVWNLGQESFEKDKLVQHIRC